MSADDIRALRRRLGLTQTAFAALLNATVPGLATDQPAVARWETGKHRPSGVAAAAIDRLMADSPDLAIRPPQP